MYNKVAVPILAYVDDHKDIGSTEMRFRRKMEVMDGSRR